MKTFILFLQILLSIFLIIMVLLQTKGTGLSTVFGGGGTFYRSRRGVEKLAVFFTILLAFLFLLFSILAVVVK